MNHGDHGDHGGKTLSGRTAFERGRETLALLLLSSVVSVVPSSAGAQALPYETKAMNLGVVNCASSLCHGSPSTWND